MVRALPVLLVLLLLAGAWFLLRGEDPGDPALQPEGPARPGAPAPGARIELRPGMPPAPPSPTPSPDGPRTPIVIDPRTLPRGPISVVVLGPDDQPVPHDDLTVDVGPGKGSRAWHVTPMLRPDPATGVWSAPDVFVGSVRVRVWGDTVVTREVETTVTAEAGEPLRVHVDRAGRIEYVVRTYADESPGDVTLTLLGAGGKPQQVYYQVRSATLLTQPQHVRSITQAPEGVVFGIAPGRYTLRATSAAGEYEDGEVEVEALKTQRVTIKVRR